METMTHDLILDGVAEAILSQPGSSKLEEAILNKVWERHQEALYARALDQVRQEQQEADEARREAWRVQKAQERRALEREAAQTAEADKDREMAEERQDFEERRQRLRAQRDEARTRASEAEAWIVDHITHLLPDGSRVLLRHAELTRFRQHTLNAILQHVGLEVRSRLTDAPPMSVEVGPQRWEQRSRFQLVRVTPGAIDREDEDEQPAAVAEGSQDA